MACAADNAISLGPLTIGIETLTTALSLYAAFRFYDQYKEDTENLSDLADKYTAIGEEYCQKAEDFRNNEILLLEYAKDYPDTAPDQHYDHGACVAVMAGAQDTLRRAYSAIPSDAVGARCQIRTEVAQDIIRRGVATQADATLRQRAMDDRYTAAKVKAYTDTLSGAVPNLGSAFNLVAETISNSAMENAEAFNAAFYTAARGAGTLWNRFSQPAQTSSAGFAPALSQFGSATPVTTGGFF